MNLALYDSGVSLKTANKSSSSRGLFEKVAGIWITWRWILDGNQPGWLIISTKAFVASFITTLRIGSKPLFFSGWERIVWFESFTVPV